MPERDGRRLLPTQMPVESSYETSIQPLLPCVGACGLRGGRAFDHSGRNRERVRISDDARAGRGIRDFRKQPGTGGDSGRHSSGLSGNSGKTVHQLHSRGGRYACKRETVFTSTGVVAGFLPSSTSPGTYAVKCHLQFREGADQDSIWRTF